MDLIIAKAIQFYEKFHSKSEKYQIQRPLLDFARHKFLEVILKVSFTIVRIA